MATEYVIFSVIFFRKGVSFVIPKLLEEGLENEQVGLILNGRFGIGNQQVSSFLAISAVVRGDVMVLLAWVCRL
jgi:hypothetical protein